MGGRRKRTMEEWGLDSWIGEDGLPVRLTGERSSHGLLLTLCERAPHQRDLTAFAEECGSTARTYHVYASRWSWQERLRAYDAHRLAQQHAEVAAERARTHRTQTRLLTTIAEKIEAALEGLDPQALSERDLIALLRWYHQASVDIYGVLEPEGGEEGGERPTRYRVAMPRPLRGEE